VTEALGQPLRFRLTAGQVHDVTQAEALLGEFIAEYVLGDKGYASAAFTAWLEARGVDARLSQLHPKPPAAPQR